MSFFLFSIFTSFFCFALNIVMLLDNGKYLFHSAKVLHTCKNRLAPSLSFDYIIRSEDKDFAITLPHSFLVGGRYNDH